MVVWGFWVWGLTLGFGVGLLVDRVWGLLGVLGWGSLYEHKVMTLGNNGASTTLNRATNNPSQNILNNKVPNWIFDIYDFSGTDWQADMRVYISVDGAGIYTTNQYVRVCKL